MPKLANHHKSKRHLMVIVLFVLMVTLIATANITIFNKKVTNINSTQAVNTNSSDLNSDGVVDIVDLSVLLSVWSTSEEESDINSDGVVDIVDLSILLSNWGETTSNTSTEEFYSKYPDPFVRVSDNQPVMMNGLNNRDVGRWSDTNQAAYDAVAAQGFNLLRFVIDWKSFETTEGVYNQTQIDRLDGAIAKAKSAGLYVILDPLHTVSPDSQPYFPTWAIDRAKANQWDAVKSIEEMGRPFLKFVAQRYKNENTVIAIDLVNEPSQYPAEGPWGGGGQIIDWNDLFDMYNLLISDVRAIDSDKILIIEPNNGDIDPRPANFNLLSTKDNIVWSPHFYYAGGTDADGYSSGGWATGNFVSNGTSGYSPVDKASLDRHVAITFNKMAEAKLPIYIGEYGIGDGNVEGDLPPPDNVPENRDQWLVDTVDVFNKYNLSRSLWEWRSRGTMSVTFQKTGPNDIPGYPETNTFKNWVNLIN